MAMACAAQLLFGVAKFTPRKNAGQTANGGVALDSGAGRGFGEISDRGAEHGGFAFGLGALGNAGESPGGDSPAASGNRSASAAQPLWCSIDDAVDPAEVPSMGPNGGAVSPSGPNPRTAGGSTRTGGETSVHGQAQLPTRDRERDNAATEIGSSSPIQLLGEIAIDYGISDYPRAPMGPGRFDTTGWSHDGPGASGIGAIGGGSGAGSGNDRPGDHSNSADGNGGQWSHALDFGNGTSGGTGFVPIASGGSGPQQSGPSPGSPNPSNPNFSAPIPGAGDAAGIDDDLLTQDPTQSLDDPLALGQMPVSATDPAQAAPEPSSIALVLAGALAWIARRRAARALIAA
ncbi:MAG TPA: PEP-CTERM sorting domain-containing protein [Burkholderiales bacterium]|nr:PEP-CTERM sorting domain-containing protein [Burkholderiales bacterium]